MKKLLKIDWIILLCTLILLSIGLFTLYSLTNTGLEARADFFQKEFTNQLIFSLIGIFLAILIFYVSPLYFRFKFILALIFLFTIGLLVFTILFGLDIRGVRRWIVIGSRVLEDGTIVGGITIQASEFAKISVIVITSALLSYSLQLSEEAQASMSKLKLFLYKNKYIFVSIITNLLVLATIFAQKSLSVATVIGFIIFTIMFANTKNKLNIILILIAFALGFAGSNTIFFTFGLPTRILLIGSAFALYGIAVFIEKLNEYAIFIAIAIGLITGSLVMNFMWNHVIHDYQKERITTFINPNRNNQSEGYQQQQSKISIGAGQFFGQGFRQISNSRLLLLPEPTTDFIFAIYSYKFGFIGSLIVIALYLLLITRLFYMADRMNDKFSSLVLVGTASMILIQFFSNIGMNIDMLPVGGTTLPFISAGGSSLMSMMISIGICENVIATNKMEKNMHQRKDKVLINGWNI